MLKLESVEAYYGSIQALKGIDLEVEEGKIVSIIGANGAGKSTLLKSISGLISQKKGRIIFNDKDITRLSPGEIVALGISQVPEGRQIFAHLTVLDNLHLGAYLYFSRKNMKIIEEKLEELFTIFPILKMRKKQISGTLSGGEQQMLAIARALMSRPKLLLLDEPSMGLAPLIVKEIFNIIKKLNSEGVTILLVEQNAKAALQISDFGYVLETGRIVLSGPSKELLENEEVKQAYLGG